MDKFEDAFKKISKVNLATHIELWGEPKTEKLYFEAGWQSRQSEFDAMTEALLNQTQLLAKQKVEVDEKGKRVKSLEKQLKRSMIAIEDGEIDWALKNIKKILRGNNANS